MDKGVQVAPLVPMLDGGQGMLPAAAPHAAQEGLEAQAVLVSRPEFDGVVGVGVLHPLDYLGKLFFKAAWTAGSALAWRGRGTVGRKPRRWRISQPRWGCTGRPSVAAIQAATFGPVHSPPSGGGWSSACQRGTLCGRQRPSAGGVMMAPVTQPRGAVLVVAWGAGAHPVGHVAGDGCHQR